MNRCKKCYKEINYTTANDLCNECQNEENIKFIVLNLEMKIEGLEKSLKEKDEEIEKLKEYKYMYEDLCK
jgi:predicted RNase H-like nuclease (RuvC/YqgF family)